MVWSNSTKTAIEQMKEFVAELRKKQHLSPILHKRYVSLQEWRKLRKARKRFIQVKKESGEL